MRTNQYNRQTRRARLCITTRKVSHRRVAVSRRGLVLTAYGHDLARLAASIADELDLSPEVTGRILAAIPPQKAAPAAARC